MSAWSELAEALHFGASPNSNQADISRRVQSINIEGGKKSMTYVDVVATLMFYYDYDSFTETFMSE